MEFCFKFAPCSTGCTGCSGSLQPTSTPELVYAVLHHIAITTKSQCFWFRATANGLYNLFYFLSLKKGHENIYFLFSLPYFVHHKDTPVVFVATLAN